MSEKTYPKYQWSYFLNGNTGNQIVVRCENSAQMENAILKALGFIQKIDFGTKKHQEVSQPAQQVVKPAAQQQPGLTATCEVHKDASGQPVKMKSRISKKGNEYWAHYRKVGNDWDTCFGKGWMSEKDTNS